MPRNTVEISADFTQKPDGFEILAISAGIGNGWNFTENVLQQSLTLWDGVQTYVDHSPAPKIPHSVRDLAGLCSSPRWDENTKGIRLQLTPRGPSAEILTTLAELVLAGEHEKPPVGFSADLTFTATGRNVANITKVHSVDVVLNPARGGTFLTALQTQLSKKELEMPIEPIQNQNPPADDVPANVGQDPEVQEPTAEDTQLSMCGYLLETALQSSKLPEAGKNHIRTQFQNVVFTPDELKTAIANVRDLASDLTAGLVVQGPGRVHGAFSADDRLQAAVDDMFNAPREERLSKCDPERLTGIRELYHMMTGDRDMHGGYYPENIHHRFADTTDFTGLVKNAMNKVVSNTWDMLGRAGYDWWKRVTVQEHFTTLNSITGILVGTVGALATVAEGGEYQPIVVGDSPETASFTKYGGYIPLTLELIDRDETHKLKAYPRELASAGLRKISALVAAIFTANSGVGPDLADTGALFNATAVTTAGGHANLLTTALSAAQWDVASQAVYSQPMLISNESGVVGTGPAMALNPKYLLVPRELQLTAMKILYPSLENTANIYSENQQRGQPGDVVTVPEWTDANNWAAACDPRVAPSIFVGERFGLQPEIFISNFERSGAVFTHDQHRLKVRHFLACWVNDFRPLHKSNVA